MSGRNMGCVVVAAAGLATGASAGPVVFSGAGANPAAIQATVDGFRAAVSAGGANNGSGGGPFLNGRREINWDGGPDNAATNPLAADAFLNGARRGAFYTTPGTGFVQSAKLLGDPGNAALRFGDIQAAYNTSFQAFSQQKLISPQGSNVMDVVFFVPNAPTVPATVRGFGAVFCDVDLASMTKIEYFDSANMLLASAFALTANNGLSFLGVSFDNADIARVRITLGNVNLGAVDGPNSDVVVLDDFVYGEPQFVPMPTAAVAGLAMLSVGVMRRRACGG